MDIEISKDKDLAHAAMGHLPTLCEVGGKKCLKLIPMDLCDSLRVHWGHWGDVFILDGSVRLRPVVRNARKRRVCGRSWPSKGHRWLVGSGWKYISYGNCRLRRRAQATLLVCLVVVVVGFKIE
jgi:hypothetical protein